MTTAYFREITITGKKCSKCIMCNKRKYRSKTFSKTLNKIDKNKNGTLKTRSDIMKELEEKIALWKEEPINCCE